MSLLREIKFVLDFHSPTIRTLTLHQYDKNSTNIIVTCMDNGIIKKIDHQSVNAYLKWKKPDGTNVLNDEIVNEDGTITIECSQQMLTADGRITAELCLVDATTQEALHTMPFFVVNKRAAIDDEEITSTSEYGALVNALIDAKSVQEFAERVPELEAAEQQRQDAETLRQQNTATAIANCEQATTDAITATNNANDAANVANTAATNANNSNTVAQGLITQMTDKIQTVEQSILDADTATENAQNAANSANAISADMTQLKSDLETAEATRVENENTRQTNETARQELSATMQGQLDSVSTAVSNCETATQNANTAADRANKAAQDAESIISGEIPTISEEFIRNLFA